MQRSNKTGLSLFKHVFVNVEGDYTKRYFNTFFLLNKLSRSERLFLDFITEEMDDENYIVNNAKTHEKFNTLLRKIKQREYSTSTIHKCFSKLNSLEVINSVKGKRGFYQINPLFFFNGSEEMREILIRRNLEKEHIKHLNKKRHEGLKEKARKNKKR